MKGRITTIEPLFPGLEYRPVFMSEVFELTYHGGGGFTWSEVWNMPVIHRRFNLKKIEAYLQKVEAIRNDQQEKLTEKSDMRKNVKIPDHLQSKNKPYVTKASKTKKT